MSILDGEIVTCGNCGQRVIFMDDGIAIDEDSETEHECNPEDES